jgi:MFS family permease
MNTISSMIFFLANRGMGRALRHRDYALYAAGGWFSNIGLWVQRIAVGWLTWTFTESWTWLGLIVFAEGITATIVMPVAGIYADRLDRLSLARITQMGLMAISALLAVFTFLEITNIWILLGLMMCCGIVEGFWTPVRMSIPPNLVPREDLASALGISASLFNLAQFIGPAVAGVIIASFETTNSQFGFAFAFNSATFLSYLIVLFIIKLREEERLQEEKSGFYSEFKAGLGYVFKTPGLPLFLFLMMSTSLCMRPFRELFAGISEGLFNEGVDGLAILTGAAGIGAVVGALVVANLQNVKGMVRLVFIFLIIDVVIQIIFAFSPFFIFSVICAAGMGFSVTIAGIAGQVLVQSAIHDEMRGRVMSLWGIIMRGGVPTGSMILGSLVGYLGFTAGLLVITGIYILILLIVIPRSRSFVERMELPPSSDLVLSKS